MGGVHRGIRGCWYLSVGPILLEQEVMDEWSQKMLRKQTGLLTRRLRESL